MTACLSYIAGDTATLAGVTSDRRPFVTELSRKGVLVLLRECTAALMDMDRAADIHPGPAGDFSPPALVGNFEE